MENLVKTEIKSKEIQFVKTSELIPYDKNMNKHTPDQIDRLCKLIEYQGFRDPLIVQLGTNRVACGHGRLEAAKKLGMAEVPVILQEFESEEQFYSFVVSHNAIAEWSALDLGQINTDIIDLGPDLDIDLLGIKDFVLEPIEKFEPQSDEDAVPEVEHPITRKGDVWLLGNHRVMCGDSTMIDDVEKLMAGEKIDLIHTDPPYGIKEDASKRITRETNSLAKSNSHLVNFNDENTDCAIDAFNLCEGFNIKNQVWWGANYYCQSLPETANWIIWDKRVEEKQKDNNSDCELAWVKSKWNSARIFRHLWKGLIKDSEHGQKRVHPTQKPVALAEWCIDFFKEDIENVMDLFGGSGSTLIACEVKNKKCYMMEFTEHYCDVIVKRWEEYTGNKATLESTGQTYTELKVERDGAPS